MSKAQADAGGLARLQDRLSGGIYESARNARPADLDFRDEEVLRNWPGDIFEALETIRAVPDVKSLTAIDTLAGQMRSRRRLLLTVLFSPHLVLARLIDSRGSSGKGLVDSWIAMCWIAEAAWCAVSGELPGDADYSEGEAWLLRPMAARLRFLVLSEPMRWRGKPDEAWWGWRPDRTLGGSGVLSRTFGSGSWFVLVGRCQEARREWLTVLNAYQSHPLLSQAKPDELEQELRAVVFRGVGSGPLALAVSSLSERATLTAEDRSVIADVIDRHLLPRFALPAVARLVLYDESPLRMSVRITFAAASALTGVAAVGCVAALLVRPAAILAAACYLLICASVLLPHGGLGVMWLLRMPAAAAVGIFALISVMAGGMLAIPLRGWHAVLVLTGASFGYLLIEACHHGVAGIGAVRRALLVVLVGAVHALMVSVVGLVALAPAFVSDGRELDTLWSRPSYGHAGMLLALAGAWCLAVGVFSQILWDDRPITAPLAHLRWRTR